MKSIMKRINLINKSDDPSNLSSKNKIKFLLKDTIFFGGLRAISLIFPFVTVPILTRYLSVDNYGLYDSLLILSGFLSMILVFGQDSAVARWFYQVENKEDKKQVVSQSFYIQIVLSILILTSLFIFSETLSVFYLNSIEYQNLIKIIIIYSFLLLINNFTINILKWSYNRKSYAILSISKPLLLFISLVLVFYFNLSLEIFLILNVIALLFSNVIGLYYSKKWLSININYKYIKNLLYYGIPIGIIASTSSLMPAIDRKMIATYLDLESMGIYAIAFKIASIIMLINGIFQMAWGPFSISIFKQDDAEKVYNLIYKILFFVFAIIIFLLNAFSPFLINILSTSQYSDANQYILPLSFAIMVNGLSGISGIGISLAMKTYLNLIPFLLSTLLLIALLYFTIPHYKLFGVAYSLLFVNIFKMAIQSFIARKVYKKIKVKYELVMIFLIILIANFLIFFNYDYGIIFIILQILFLSFLLFFFFLNSTERIMIKKRIIG